jgi:hypothetical protein
MIPKTKDEHLRELWEAAITIEKTLALCDSSEQILEQAQELNRLLMKYEYSKANSVQESPLMASSRRAP